MNWQSAWLMLAVSVWLGACGSRSDSGLTERLGEAEPKEVGVAGAAGVGAAESSNMNSGGVPGTGGVDPTLPAPGGMMTGQPGVVPPPMQAEPVWFPRGEIPLRHDELYRSATALLGVEFPPEPRSDFYQQQHLIENLSAAERGVFAVSAAWLDELLSQVTDEQLLLAVGCEADGGCSPDALAQFATRAWRRPLSGEGQAQVQNTFELALGAGGEAQIRGFVRLIFLAPEFSLLSLLGEPVGEAYQLTDFELASRLSFQFTGGPPDAELWEAAAAGVLRDADNRVKQARRLLAGAEAQAYVTEWVALWFGAVAPENSSHPLGAETLNEETRRMLQYVLFDAQLPLQRLLDADYTFVNQDLAEWYGLPDVGEGWSMVSLANTTRRGLLHHASWLGQRQLPEDQHYAWRGTLPSRLICSSLPPPPSGGVLPEPVVSGTPREQMEAFTAGPSCVGCHAVLNPVAFSFDHYDGWGQHRTTFSTGEPIDASGGVQMFNGEHYEFADSADFVTQLGASEAYIDCFRQIWVGSGSGRRDEHADLQSYLQHSKRAVLFPDLALQFVGSDHYVWRR